MALTLAGVGVVANKPESKQPLTKGWQKRGLRLDEIPHHFETKGTSDYSTASLQAGSSP